MRNESGLKPLGRAVLIRTYEPEINAGKIFIPDTVRERTSMIEQRAIIIEVGPIAWADEGYFKPWFFGLFRRWVNLPRAVPGDKVVVSKYAGWMTTGPADGKVYRMINCNDVFAGITAEMVPLADQEVA